MGNAIKLDVDRRAKDEILDTLALFILTPQQKKIIINKAGTDVRKKSRRNIREKRTVDGGSFPDRSPRRNGKRLKRRMLKGLARYMSTHATNKGVVRVGWKNPVMAKIAYRHQHGVPEQSGRILASQQEDYVKRKEPCPRWLAKRILALGWVDERKKPGRPKKGKKARTARKRRTVKWIMENMTRGQASAIMYRLEGRDPHEKWTIKTPKREFLGVTDAEASELIDSLAKHAFGNL